MTSFKNEPRKSRSQHQHPNLPSIEINLNNQPKNVLNADANPNTQHCHRKS